MLNLNIRSVCQMANVGIRTLTEFEAGKRRLNQVTEAAIVTFYMSEGIVFGQTTGQAESVTVTSRIVEPSALPRPTSESEVFKYLAVDQLVENIDLVTARLSQTTDQIKYSSTLLVLSMIIFDINQKELAQRLDCSQNFISLIIAGKKKLSPLIAERLAVLHGLPVTDLKKILDAEKNLRKQLRDAVRIISEVQSQAAVLQELATNEDVMRA